MINSHHMKVTVLLVFGIATLIVNARTQQTAKSAAKSNSKATPTRAQLNSALAVAAGKANLDRVNDLLHRGADPNAIVNGSPILVLAAAGGSVEDALPGPNPGSVAIVEALIEAGAKPDAVNGKGERALDAAVVQSNIPLLNLLLNHNVSIEQPNNDGLTPLMEALVVGNLETVKLLLDHKANPNARTKDGATPLAFLLIFNEQSELVQIMTRTATKRILFETLVGAGADVKAKTTDGTGLLTLASQGGNVECARLMLEKGADINERSSSTGGSPLFNAAVDCKAPMVRFLLSKGADPNVAGADGVTPLMVCVQKGNYAIADMLLKHGAKVSSATKQGFTALTVAREQHMTGLINLLKAAGAMDEVLR
jgi:ankyrin repeat protein